MATPLSAPFVFFVDSNGAPLAGGLVYTYTAGTTTPQNSYTDSTAGTPNANPVVLDSAGRASIWLVGSYKIVVKDSLGNTIHTDDNITALSVTSSFVDNAFLVTNLSDATKKIALDASGITTGTTRTFTAPDKNGTFAMTSDVVLPSPQGRLSLTTGVPVMNADATGQTTVYYFPYTGQNIPIYSGSAFVNFSIGSQISLALDSNSGHTGYHQSTKLFDLFVYSSSGTATLATGPAWSSATARSAAISYQNGIWTNSSTITLRFGSVSGNTVNVGANQATYVGTMYATANGQTGMQFKPSAASGGSANTLGLYNAYNRVRTHSTERDSTATWTYGTLTWRKTNNNTGNSINFVDGLQQSHVDSTAEQSFTLGSNIIYGLAVGVLLDATSGTPNIFNGNSGVDATEQGGAFSRETFTPQIGFHNIQMMEIVTISATSMTINGNGQQALTVSLDM